MFEAFALLVRGPLALEVLEARNPVDALLGGDVLHSSTNVAIRL